MWETIANFSPIMALRSVLFPAFGFPKIFTNPTFIKNGIKNKRPDLSSLMVAKRRIELLTFGL